MIVRIVRGQTPQQQADALANANLKQLESLVLSAVQGKLHAGKIRLDTRDVEAAYNLAWHGVCQHVVQGREVTNLTGLLIKITHERSIDIYRRRHEAQHSDADLQERGAEVDLAERLDDQLKLQRLIARLKQRLNENERKGVTLCLLHGFRRPEAADMLGIEQAAFQRIMDGATKKLAGVVAGIDARGCGGEEWARLLRSYALGLLSKTDRDYARAVEHIDECETCKRYVIGLQGLAAVMPPVGLPFMPLMGHEQAILAHLYRMFGGGHGASGAGAIQTGAGTAGAATGGGTLVGSISAGAAAKGVAVIAIVVVAVGVGSAHHGRSHRLAPRPAVARPTPAVAPPTAVASEPVTYPPRNAVRGPARNAGGGPARRITHSARHATAPTQTSTPVAGQAVQKEFEIEPSAQGASSAAPAGIQGSSGSTQSVEATEREFGPERP
jgi:DNA-directed RNA polymerase specialized sigma24 family protein